MARNHRSDARTPRHPRRRARARRLEHDRAVAAGVGSRGVRSPALLRESGKTRAHLPCLADGAKGVPRERRRSRDYVTRLVAGLEVNFAAVEESLKQHDLWLLARELLAQTRRPPLDLKTAGADRVRALATARLGRYDRQGALCHAARGAEPRRRARPARGDGLRPIPGMGTLVR